MSIIARIVLYVISRMAARNARRRHRRRQGTAEFHHHGDDRHRRSGRPAAGLPPGPPDSRMPHTRYSAFRPGPSGHPLHSPQDRPFVSGLVTGAAIMLALTMTAADL